MSSRLLDLAEAYYKVAEDMGFQARRYGEIANVLNQMADRLCEQNMKQTPMAEAPASDAKEGKS